MAAAYSRPSKGTLHESLEIERENRTSVFKESLFRKNGDEDHLQYPKEKIPDKIDLPNRAEELCPQEQPLNLPSPPPSQKAVSKRSLRLAKMKGEIGSDDRPKGQVQYDNEGNMYQRENDNEAWKPAIFHEKLRASLIARAHQLGQYDHPRAKGQDGLDVTSFLFNQKPWGAEREQWPEILHQIRQRPEQKQGTRASLWLYNGMIVIDPDNHPVLDYPEIPATCSSELEGWYMQAIKRSNHQISTRDFRARMPHFVGRSQRPLYRVNAISMRMTRFRAEAGCQVWDLRAGSRVINNYMMDLYPAWCIETNSTRDFSGLTKSQTATMNRLLKGQFPERARARPEGQHSDNVQAVVSEGIGTTMLHQKPHGLSSAGQKWKHGNLDEHMHSDMQTYTPVAKHHKTNDLATEISGSDVLQLERLRKRPLERNLSCKEEGVEELNDWVQIKRPCLNMDYPRMNHIHGGRFSHLDPRLLTVQDSTGWSSYDQDSLGEDRPRQVLASLMPLTSESYNMRIPVQPAYSSVALISNAPSLPAVYLPEYFPGQNIPMETQYSSDDTLNYSTPMGYGNTNDCGDLAENQVVDDYINAGSMHVPNEGSDACAGSRL